MLNLKENLEEINERMIEMVRKTARSIEVVGLTLESPSFDKYLYGESKLLEEESDDLEVAIERETVYAIVRYQPAAGDLRYLVGTMKLITDLERISDLCCSTMTLIKYVFDRGVTTEFFEPLKRMIKKIEYIFSLFEKSFIEQDVKTSYLIFGLDDEVDDIRDQLYTDVEATIRGNIEITDCGLKVIVVAQKFERIADLIQNLGENAVYISKGDVLKHKNIGE